MTKPYLYENIFLNHKILKMTLKEVTEQFEAAKGKMPNLGKSLKFVFDEGIVHVDLTGDEPVITNLDNDADTTITTSLETLDGLRKGTVNPMTAVFTGKVKIKGDMGLAMKLQSFFS
ncbi:MAG: SCP2 sterol-binding domain-containing protein [Saprospiraceae bacterium]